MIRVFLALSLSLLLAAPSSADVPRQLSYQGELTDLAGIGVSGTIAVTFRLYDAEAAPSAIWTEVQNVDFGTDGLFDVMLGSVTSLSLPFDRPYWLGIQVDGDTEMLPRIPLSASPYALHSADVADSIVTAPKILDGTVVRGVNGLTDQLQIVGGTNVTVSSNGNVITISSTGGGGGADADWVVNGSDQYSAVSGNVGIGITNPSHKLHVQTSVNDPVSMALRSGGSWNLILEQDPSSIFSISNGGQKRLVMPANGNLGLGTESPTARLDVAGGTDPQLVVDSSDDSGDDAGIVIRGSRNASTSVDVAYLDLQDFDNDEGATGTEFSMARISAGMDATSGQRGWLRMQTNDGAGIAERMRITSQGNVGIGTSSPTSLLEVAGRAEITGPGGGRLEMRDGTDQLTLELDAQESGGGSVLNLYNGAARSVELDASEDAGGMGVLRMYSAAGATTLMLQAQDGGVATNGGVLRLFDDTGQLTTKFYGKHGNGGALLRMYDEAGQELVTLDANEGDVGSIMTLRNEANLISVELDSHEGSGDGVVRVFDATGVKTVELNGDQGSSGNVAIFNDSGVRTIALDAREGDAAGQILLYDATGTQRIEIDADKGGTSRIVVDVLELTGGADLSEQFEVSFDGSSSSAAAGAPEPGMVVCIDPDRPGELRVSERAYDTRVAGIISGAGGVRPGMLMGQKGSVADGEYPVALTGRVYVRADATTGAIEPGDLLTTSGVAGHAMRVDDPARATGAILGKAMTSLESGRGLVLVLVSLQ